MNNLAQAIWVEMLKFRRSKMPLLTMLGFLMVPFMGGFFMIILKDPELARRAGLISAKAQLLAGTAESVAVGGIILFGFLGSWVFGREYSDRTMKDLLALPTSRSVIVLAKFVVVMGWSAIVTAVITLVGFAVGTAVGLPTASSDIFQQGTVSIIVSAVLTISLITPIAFFASAGHGYLPPMGATILAIFLAQIVAVAGYGEYFPWSIPALYSQGNPIELVSYLIVFLAGIIGAVGTFLWWELADHTH